MQNVSEMNRINYANHKHHRELIRQHIDPRLIDRLEISQNPSNNYKNAFKGIYQDELEKTLDEQKDRKNMELSSLYHQQTPARNSLYQAAPSPINHHSQSLSRIKRPFHDFQEEKAKKYNVYLEKTLHQGSTFFRAQDTYQERKKLELQANHQILQEQLNQKEMQKQQYQQQYQRQNLQVKENRLRQVENEMVCRQKSKMMQNDLRSQIVKQMEGERVRKHHKSIANLGTRLRHNPITNPIEYHIDNPYILCKIQDKENGY